MNLQNAVVIVTGAGTGIGAATAQKLGAAGAQVVLVGRRPEPLEKVAGTVREAGGIALVHPADVTNRAATEKLAAATLEQFGRIDALINNAGLIRLGDFFHITEEDWDTTLDINLKSVFLCCKAVVPHMAGRKAGRIINVSSVSGVTGVSRSVAYAASKAGLIGLSRYLAMNLKEYGIAVTVVNPGMVYTPFHEVGPMPEEDLCMEAGDVAETLVHILQLPERAVLKEVLMMPRVDL